MANEFVVNGLFLYRQYDEQVYIWHPNKQDKMVDLPIPNDKYHIYTSNIDKFVYKVFTSFDKINIYYLISGFYATSLIKLDFDDNRLVNHIIRISSFYIPYPLPDPTLEAERQAILNEYILTNNI